MFIVNEFPDTDVNCSQQEIPLALLQLIDIKKLVSNFMNNSGRMLEFVLLSKHFVSMKTGSYLLLQAYFAFESNISVSLI